MIDNPADETLQQQLDAFLAFAEGDVLLWHDPQRRFEDALPLLALPSDVVLVREDSLSPLAAKLRVEDVDPDERLLLYRACYRDVLASDWLADVESRADWFAASADAALPEGNEAPVGRDVPTGYATETAYFDSFFQGSMTERADIPAEMLACQSFKVFLSRRMLGGRIFPYEGDSWITAAGLAEMGVTAADLEGFARGALDVMTRAGAPCFTVTFLRRNAPGLPLLAFGFSDAFYAAALMSQQGLLDSAKLCNVRVFCPAGTSPRGRDVIEAIACDVGSVYVDELLYLLRDDYGIPITRGLLLTLVKKTGLYLYPGIDKLFPSYEQFLREVE